MRAKDVMDRPGSRQADQERSSVIAALSEHNWSQALRSDVVASDGMVHLWGPVSSDSLRTTDIEIAQGVPGVASVRSHLHIANR